MTGWRYNALDRAARLLPPPVRAAAARVVYTPGHLGDVLHAVPMLKALRHGKPEAKIIWLVGPWSAALARRYAGLVDEIRIFGPNLPNYARGRREWRQSAWRQWRLALDLRRNGVDVLVGPMDGVGRFLANALCPRLWTGIGGKPHPDFFDGDFARAFAGADAVTAQACAQGAVFDGQDRHRFAPAQQSDGIDGHGEFRRFQERFGGLRGEEGADLAGHQAPVDLQGQAFDLEVVAGLRHAVEEPVREVGRQADEMEIGEQRRRQQQQREERAQDPVGRMADRHQQERGEPPAPGAAVRGRGCRRRIHAGQTSASVGRGKAGRIAPGGVS